MITGTTRLLGVIGDPIHHSLSPVMHNAAMAHLHADYAYLPFPIAPADLERSLAGFEAIGVQGFSVTIPHKQAIMPFLSEISETAQAIGAVNTVWRTEQGWKGTNTDAIGFLAPLRSLAQDWNTTTAVVLGNGGAARAVVAACTQLGCRQIRVVGRNADKLQAFEQSWRHTPLAPPLSVHPWDALPNLLPATGLLVNTTPIGMTPQDQNSPLSSHELTALAPQTIAYDLIYTPRPTLFLQQAQAHGATIIDGLEMLVQQGAAALELWLNQPAPVDVMRRSLLEYLAQRG